MNDHRCVVGGGKFLPPGSPYIEELRKKFRCPNPAYNQAMVLRQKGKYIQVPDENVYACQMIPIRHLWARGALHWGRSTPRWSSPARFRTLA